MKVDAELKSLKELVAKLRELAAKSQKEGNPVVAVGFTAAYAIYIHENMEIWPPGMRLRGLPRGLGLRRDPETGVVIVPSRMMRTGTVGGKHKGFYWDPQGKAGPKFLESPARELKAEFGRIIMQALMQGKSLTQGLLLAGLRLQREAMLRVPVDTGNLKASAFTRIEEGTPGDGAIPV